jgi:hypothetical protein
LWCDSGLYHRPHSVKTNLRSYDFRDFTVFSKLVRKQYSIHWCNGHYDHFNVPSSLLLALVPLHNQPYTYYCLQHVIFKCIIRLHIQIGSQIWFWSWTRFVTQRCIVAVSCWRHRIEVSWCHQAKLSVYPPQQWDQTHALLVDSAESGWNLLCRRVGSGLYTEIQKTTKVNKKHGNRTTEQPAF